MFIMDDSAAVDLFKELLRFRTISGEGPSGSYAKCAKFLAGKLEHLGFKVEVHEFVKNKPVVIATLVGKDPSLPSILLNGHYGTYCYIHTHGLLPVYFDMSITAQNNLCNAFFNAFVDPIGSAFSTNQPRPQSGHVFLN
jgi:hypothetical protein